jgi:glycosyltransferase involved in cell wall biosynthesis
VRNTYINRFGKEKCGHVKVLYNPLLGTYELDDAEVRNLRERHFREAIFTFGLVGRVEPFKRLEEAIKAAHALRSVRPKFRILIVGADSLREGSTYRNRLQAMITEFQLEECIFFTGFIASIHEMTVLLDCLILCTEGEALSRSVYEAQVLSVPVIASDSGGNPELIQDGESGLLYELGNPSDLSKKMQLMMDSEHLRNTLRRNAAHSVTERFSMATTVRKEEIYYLALLEGK